MLRVQLFEDVCRQLLIALDRVDDLLAFLMRGALHQVGDLGGVQPAQPLQRHQELGGRDMADERLHVLPIQDRVPAQVGPRSAWDEAPQHRARAAVDTEQFPPVVDVPEHQVVRTDDATMSDIHQVATQDVGGEQHLAGASLEGSRVESGAAEPHLSGDELVDVLHPDVDVAATDADLDPGHRGIDTAALAELDDQILQPAELVARRVEHGAVEDLREHHPPFFAAWSVVVRHRAPGTQRTVDLSVAHLLAHRITAQAVLHLRPARFTPRPGQAWAIIPRTSPSWRPAAPSGGSSAPVRRPAR